MCCFICGDLQLVPSCLTHWQRGAMSAIFSRCFSFGKPCLPSSSPPLSASSFPDSVPAASSALHRSGPACVPAHPPAVVPAPAAQVPAVDGLPVCWLSMVCRSQFRAPWLKSSFPPFYQTLDTAPNLISAKLIEFSPDSLYESIAK